MSSRVTKDSPNKLTTVVPTKSAWAHPELKPLNFTEFRSRLLSESGFSINTRKIYRLLLGHAGRKSDASPSAIADGLLFWGFAEFLEERKSTHVPGLGLVDRSEFQAALCHHPIAVLRTIEYAREILLGGEKISDQNQKKFDRLERAWLIKGTLEESWLSGYLKGEGCAAAAFHVRLRLAELFWGMPQGDHYLQLARELCGDDEVSDFRAERLEEKLTELSEHHSAAKLIVCAGPFSEQAGANERDALQLKHYSALQKPLQFACIERPLESIRSLLNAQFPWMSNVTQHFMEQLQTQVLLGQQRIALRPTLLVGEPGIGKNRYLNLLAKELGLPSQLIAIGGSSDNRALMGCARGWSTGRPLQVLTLMVNSRVANPLIILDEIEKEGSGNHNGRNTDTLHQLLENGNAKRWYDEFLLTECDLSWVNWIACANSLNGLSDSLLSRFEVVRVARPAQDDLYAVVYGTIKDLAARHQQPLAIMPTLSPDCWALLEDCFKRGYGPRTVAKVTERLMAAVMVSEASVLVH